MYIMYIYYVYYVYIIYYNNIRIEIRFLYIKY